MRLAIATAALLWATTCSAQPPATVQTPTDLIPIYAANPTVWAVADGDWCNTATWNTGAEPVATDRVWIPSGRKVNLCNEAATCDSIAVEGTLTTLVDRNTRLSTGTIQVLASGTYTAGTQAQPVPLGIKAEVVFRDGGFAANDPDEFGRGLIVLGKFESKGVSKTPCVRISREYPVGATVIQLDAAPVGWQAGDSVCIPDTDPLINAYAAPQRLKIASISGTTVTLQSPTTKPIYGCYDYTGAPPFEQPTGLPAIAAWLSAWKSWLTDFNAIPKYRPHMANETRNIVFRSENPDGKRGHIILIMGSQINAANIEIAHMGRTRNKATDASNHIARYPWHAHHANNVTADNLAIHDSYRWAMGLHNVNGVRYSNNVIVECEGAGIQFESGTEHDNVLDNNFICGVRGYTAVRADAGGGLGGGNEGAGIWMSNVQNTITRNVTCNTQNLGYTIFNGSGFGTLLRWEGNETYSSGGLTMWYVGLRPDNASHPDPGGTIKDFTCWNFQPSYLGRSGVGLYQTGRVTFDGAKVISCAKRQPNNWFQTLGFHNGDYPQYELKLVNSEIQAPGAALLIPNMTTPTQETVASEFVAENTVFTGVNCVLNGSCWQSSLGYNMGPRVARLKNCKFNAINLMDTDRDGVGWPFSYGGPTKAWKLVSYLEQRTIGNNIVRDRTFVEKFDQKDGDDFEYFFLEQSPTYVVPASKAGLVSAQDNANPPNPISGLTNQQYWAQFGRAIRGAVSPTSEQRAGVLGFVLPSGSTPPPPQNQPPIAANDSVTTAYETPVAIDVLANDADADGTLDPETLAVTALVGGTWANGTFAPAAGFSGQGGFDYTVKDNQGAASNTAHVTVTVQAKPPDPTDPCEQYKQQIAALQAQVAALTAEVAALKATIDKQRALESEFDQKFKAVP